MTEELLQLALQGDAEALSALLEEVGPEVRRSLAGRIPARWRSVLSEDDVMQQTYADAFRSIGKFVPLGGGAFRAWLSAMAECNLQDAMRMLNAERRGGNRKRVHALAGGDSYRSLLDVLSSSGTSPTQQVARTENAAALRGAVDSLPEAYRKVVHMYDLEGRPIGDVADALNRTPGAVYMLRARAHDRLREILGPAGGFFTDSA